MKRITLAALAALTLAATLPNQAFAGYAGSGDWLEKTLFGAFEVYGGGWDFLYGGGLALDFELVSKTYHVGVGARSGFGFWAGSDDNNWDYTDETWDNDVRLLLWLSDDFTLYGGIGATFHIMKCDGLVESTSYYRNGRTRRYTYQLKTVTYETEAATDTQYWFVGARWRIQDHFFVFGEYRKTRGKFELTTDDLDYYNKLRSFEQDMDASCVMIGVGWLF